MNRRPVPIVLLALFQALTPFFNLFVNSVAFSVSPMVLIKNLFLHQPLSVVLEFVALGPLAAVAIYSFRRWSYALFLACMTWGIVTNVLSWRASPGLISFPLLIGVSAMSCLLVSYFMLPAVRAAYWYPSLRWWESRPRFRAEGEVTMGAIKGKYRNVSEGGLFVETQPTFNAGDKVRVSFTLMGEAFEVDSRVAFASTTLRGGYGLQLIAGSKTSRRLRKAVQDLEAQGAVRMTPKPRFIDDFRAWVSELKTTGRGLVPTLNPIAQARLMPGAAVNKPEQKKAG